MAPRRNAAGDAAARLFATCFSYSINSDKLRCDTLTPSLETLAGFCAAASRMSDGSVMLAYCEHDHAKAIRVWH